MVYIHSFKEQSWLLPPSIEDLISEDHICILVENLIESLDFSSFDIRYNGPGHPAYHPRILLKLLVMGVLDKIRSSRKLSRNARENIVYMYLAEKLTPDFRTISDFRKNNPDLVKEVFKHTVTLAKSEGMIDLSHLSTDGSKQKANAANKRVLTKEELEFLLRFIDDELEEWAKQDDIEKEKEIDRLLKLKNIYTEKLKFLGQDRKKLTSEAKKIKNQMEDEKEKASRNEDEMIKEIVFLEKETETNLALQIKQQEEIDLLKEKINQYTKSLQKESRQKTKNHPGIKKRFDTIYKNLSINERAINGFIDLTDDMKIKVEEIIHQLNENPKLVSIKRKVFGKKGHETVLEVIFAYKGRLYYRKTKDNKIEVLVIGTKNTQTKNLEFLRGIGGR